MAKKRSISNTYLRLSLSLSTLIVILVGATMIAVNTQHHNEMLEKVSGRIVNQLKEAMTLQVEGTVELVQQVHEDATQNLKEKLAKEVRQAHQQASKILKNNPDLPLSRQKELIIETLRPIQFNDNRGSIFIANASGELKLNPVNSQYEGTNIKKLPTITKESAQLIDSTLQQVVNQGELYVEGVAPGFMDDPYSKADPTIVFYKHLDVLDWVIGTKESVHSFEKETKEQLLAILSKLHRNMRLRLFIADNELNLLALPGQEATKDELDLYEVLPENRELINKAIQLAKENKSEVIQAQWFDRNRQRYEPILLYMNSEPNWKWLIGSFVTLSDIEKEVGLDKSRLADRVEDQISDIAAILVVTYILTVIVGLFIYRKMKWHFNLFIDHLQHAAHDNRPVEGEMISIKEFDALAQTMNEQLEKRATLQSELERLAQKDPLTNLYNRRRMDELLSIEISRVKRTSNPFSIILCDIDHFKSINDTYGHETGDQVIIAVSEILLASLREQDIIARWGGEEFLIALPDTDINQAQIVAEKIRKQCENHTVNHAGQQVRFTLTFGLDVFDGSVDIKAAIASADQALYEGKNRGRNTVVFKSKSGTPH